MKDKKVVTVTCLVLSVIIVLAVFSSCEKAPSAYDVAINNGFTGSEQEWLESLKGTNGKDGVGISEIRTDDDGNVILIFTDGTEQSIGNIGEQNTDKSKTAPKLNTYVLNINESGLFLLVSDRPNCTFESSNSKVVEVSKEGLLVAVSEGSADITVTAADGKKSVCRVNSYCYEYSYAQDGTVILTDYYGSGGKLIIPDNIKGISVSEIAPYAFEGHTDITSVTIPDCIKTIGDHAFNNCSSLSEVFITPSTEYNKAASFAGTAWFANNAMPIHPDMPQGYIAKNDKTSVYTTGENDLHESGGSTNIYNTPNRSDQAMMVKDGTPITRVAVIYERADDHSYGWSMIVYQNKVYYIRNSQLKIEMAPDETIMIRDFSKLDEKTASEKGPDYPNIKDEAKHYIPNMETINGIDVSVAEKDSESPVVLILHTHGTESYAENDVITNNSADKTKNVVAIGTKLAELLNQKGINTVHCELMHDAMDDGSQLSAYEQAAITIQKYLEQYPSIKYIIDIHRDSYEDEIGNRYKGIAETSKGSAAQIMFVVGTGSETDPNPNTDKNLALAQKLRSEVNSYMPEGIGLCRPTFVQNRPHGYNQQISDAYSILIEVGFDGNTLDEAKLSVDYIANAIENTIVKK